MQNLYLLLTLVFVLCLPLPTLAAEEFFTGKMELVVPKSTQDSSNIKPAKEWYPSGEPQGDKGDIWEQGTSFQELNRRRTPQGIVTGEPIKQAGVNTRGGIEHQLKNIAEYERSLDDKPLTFGDGQIKGESSVEMSTWRPSVTEPVKIDEPVLASQRNVVGAYANMVDDENFKMSAGPELHLQEDNESIIDGNEGPPQNSEVGMGMKFQWDF